MNAISMLDVAGDVLAVEEFSAALISVSNVSGREQFLDDKDGDFVLGRLRTLMQPLSNTHIPTRRQSSNDEPRSSSDMLTLRELVSSCVHDTEALLEDVEKGMKDWTGKSSQNWGPDTRIWFRSMIGGRPMEGKLERLCNAVARHAGSIIK
jgi:hypothetical protein